MKASSLLEGQQIPYLPEELFNDQHASHVIGHVGYPAHKLSPLPSRRRAVCPSGNTNLCAGVARLESSYLYIRGFRQYLQARAGIAPPIR
jgi:hypothetical protein